VKHVPELGRPYRENRLPRRIRVWRTPMAVIRTGEGLVVENPWVENGVGGADRFVRQRLSPRNLR